MLHKSKQIFLFFCFVLLELFSLALRAQTQIPQIVCQLPAALQESSGLISLNAGATFWTHNDSGGKSLLYEIDSNCQILRTIHVSGVTSVDWEEIALDDSGNVYIGDFGNNDNNRKDLVIYRIPEFDKLNADSISAERIEFSYINQFDFPPSSEYRNFDMEAFIWLHGKLYLFSKNRTSPFSGYTYLHLLPDRAGSYQTQLVDSFYTGSGLMQQFWITGAAINEKKDQLFLLSYDKAWLFYPLDTQNLFRSPVRQLQFPSITQKEGVTFGNASFVWMTDEYFSTFRNGGTLLKLNLDRLLSLNNNFSHQKIQLFPVPADDFILISGENIQSVLIQNFYGQTVMEIDHPELQNIPVSHLPSGTYLARIVTTDGSETLPWIKK